MTSAKSISIVIALYNQVELTKACLSSIGASLDGYDYEIILVDDCSTDETRNFLRSIESTGVRIHLNQNKGNFAINNNIGVSMAKHDKICLLNNDTIVQSDWLDPMLEALNKFPDAGLIGNVQKIPATNRYDHFGVCFPKWLTPIHYGQHLKKRPKLASPYSRWAAVTAACVLIKKDTFLSVDGFDETYVNGCEDMDLCIRLHKKGHWHYVAHESVILHHKGSSPDRKKHNNANLDKFKATHGAYLREHIVPRDARLAAKSYLKSAAAAPSKTNLSKFTNSLFSVLNIHPKKSLRNPDWVH